MLLTIEHLSIQVFVKRVIEALGRMRLVPRNMVMFDCGMQFSLGAIEGTVVFVGKGGRGVCFLLEHNKIMGGISLLARAFLQSADALLGIHQSRMQVLVLDHKLLALLHVLTLEEIL